MNPSEIRKELLGQHEALRAIMDGLRDLAGRVRLGEPLDIAMHEGMVRLATALAEHNAREEELLRDLIPTADAWGPARVELMDETHCQEHAELEDMLAAIREAPVGFLEMMTLFERLLEHMALEERDLLAADVLKDELIVVDASG